MTAATLPSKRSAEMMWPSPAARAATWANRSTRPGAAEKKASLSDKYLKDKRRLGKNLIWRHGSAMEDCPFRPGGTASTKGYVQDRGDTMLITEMLARNARTYGGETALVEREPEKGKRREIDWRLFDDTANRTARALRARGIEKGDRVVLLMVNCLEWLPIYFGILRTGALAVPLNFRFGADTIRRCVQTAGARAMIFGEAFAERIAAVKTGLDRTVAAYLFVGNPEQAPAYAETYAHALAGQDATDPGVSLKPADAAGLYFTSGTTGVPKGVLLTHGNLAAACIVENRHHRQTHTDNFLCIPPLYHTGAKMHWFGSLRVGAKAVILKGVKPEWIIAAVSEERVTIVWLLVPWALDILWAVESGRIRPENYCLDQWRLMHIGAQPVPPSLVQNWLKVFPGHQYDTNYGLTESSGPGCIHLGTENLHKVGAIGRPGFDWHAKIVDTGLDPVAAGQTGELLVKGPGVMSAYYRTPENIFRADPPQSHRQDRKTAPAAALRQTVNRPATPWTCAIRCPGPVRKWRGPMARSLRPGGRPMAVNFYANCRFVPKKEGMPWQRTKGFFTGWPARWFSSAPHTGMHRTS